MGSREQGNKHVQVQGRAISTNESRRQLSILKKQVNDRLHKAFELLVNKHMLNSCDAALRKTGDTYTANRANKK